MCGRYTLSSNLDALQGRFNFQEADLQYQPRYNVAPTQTVLAVVGGAAAVGVSEVNEAPNQARLMRWGLIPSWARDAAIGARMINARAETVAEKPSFRSALRRRRCLVLADGFYEWRGTGKGKTPKTPMYIALKSREPFGMAGLWETWRSPEGELVHSCAVITTTPNSLMEPIHNRMPVILAREAEEPWLDAGLEDPESLSRLLVPFPAGEMEAHQVSTLVNSPRNDSPECVFPAETQGSLGELG